VHLAQEQATIDVIVEMLSDGVNAMYAAKPAGSFATLQKLAAVAGSSASAGDLGGGASSASLTESSVGHGGGVTVLDLPESSGDLKNEDEDAITYAAARPRLATAEQQAKFGVFLKQKKMIDDHLMMLSAGSSGGLHTEITYAADHPPRATDLRPNVGPVRHTPQEVNVMHIVATSGGTETYPASFSHLRATVPIVGQFVGVLPTSNNPVYNVDSSDWPTVGVAAHKTTRAVRRMESHPFKGTNVEVNMLELEAKAARLSYTDAIFARQEVGRNNMVEFFDGPKSLPPAPDVEERGYGVLSASAGVASRSTSVSSMG
jgi:hypothetical protein